MNRTQTWIVTIAAAAGAAIGAAGIAAATAGTTGTTGTTGTSTQNSAAPEAPGGDHDPAKVGHGPGETLLTGDTATKVTAAAKAAVPGGTIIRVETDSAGSPYEAHVRKSDGTEVTVKVDASFKVTAVENGFGKGPDGGPGHH